TIEFNKKTDEIETDDVPAPAPTVAAAKPSADADALDALIQSTPDSPMRAAVARPISIPAGEEADVEVEDTPAERAARTGNRYANDGYDRRNIDPNEIQKVPARKIQNVWY